MKVGLVSYTRSPTAEVIIRMEAAEAAQLKKELEDVAQAFPGILLEGFTPYGSLHRALTSIFNKVEVPK